MSRILDTSQRYEKSILDRLIQEGDGIGNSGLIQSSYGTFPAGLQSGAGIAIGGFTVPHGKALYIHKIIVSSNKSAWFYCQTGGNLSGGFGLSGVGVWTGNTTGSVITPANGGTTEIVVNQVANGGFTSSTGGSAFTIFVKQVFDEDKTGCVFSVSIIGKFITDDFNIGAEKVILWKGDSVSAGIGVSSKLKMLPWKIRQHVFDNTKGGARLICKAYGGSTSKWFDHLRRCSYFDYEQVDIIVYQLALNDPPQGTTNAEYYANIKAEIAYNSIKYPLAKQVYLGATPRADSYETALVGLRTQMQNAVNEARAAGNTNVFYCSLAGAFDRNVLTNYDLSDGVHPNDTATDSEFVILRDFFTNNKILAA